MPRKYMEADQFEKGSMLPKIEAGISFIEKGAHRRAIITDMAHAQDAIKKKQVQLLNNTYRCKAEPVSEFCLLFICQKD